MPAWMPTEQSMYRFVDEARQSVEGFRNSERESESQQQIMFLGKTQELMVTEQQVAEQVALLSRAEHQLNEEYSTLRRSKQDSDIALRREIEELGQERGKLRVELMTASRDTGAMHIAKSRR